jgi:hypothetical protein
MDSFNKPGAEERTYNTRPPDPVEALVKVYRQWRRKHSSDQIPKDFLAAAKFWLEHQEPQKENEQPVAMNDNKGNQHWTTPHIERMVAAFRVFLDLNETEKAYIIHHIEHGIVYRGDDMEFFKRLVEQHEVMQKYIDKYGRTADGLLPVEYTTMILNQVGKLVTHWDNALPYDKDERES